MVKKCCLLWLASLILLSLISIANSDTEETLVLITAREADTPDLPSSDLHIKAGRKDEGPIIEVVAPERGKRYKSPLQIIIKFIPKEGKEIDLSTMKVQYLKLLTIDITQRVKPYATENGINLPRARLPSGSHAIRLMIGDITGAITRQVFYLEVF
jgi:hypothetical protein|tara:strand:- start:5173 stop:5640 length:468 start_codon:yes stop_codon:yes gene_type:complete